MVCVRYWSPLRIPLNPLQTPDLVYDLCYPALTTKAEAAGGRLNPRLDHFSIISQKRDKSQSGRTLAGLRQRQHGLNVSAVRGGSRKLVTMHKRCFVVSCDWSNTTRRGWHIVCSGSFVCVFPRWIWKRRKPIIHSFSTWQSSAVKYSARIKQHFLHVHVKIHTFHMHFHSRL